MSQFTKRPDLKSGIRRIRFEAESSKVFDHMFRLELALIHAYSEHVRKSLSEHGEILIQPLSWQSDARDIIGKEYCEKIDESAFEWYKENLLLSYGPNSE